MLKKLSKVFLLLGTLTFVSPLAQAKESETKSEVKSETQQASTDSGTKVEFVSTGEGDIRGSDAVIADDPYAGKTLTERDKAGHASTQREYQENCAAGDDMCQRAKARQTNEGSWKDDVKEGRRGSY